MSTFSPNLQLEEVARGGDVGTWDTPTNSNWTLMDSCVGQITTISLNNANVILNSAQFQSRMITFNSTLTGSVQITFPTSFIKSYEIQNVCTGTSAFVVQLLTTAAGGQIISCPPGETVDVVNDGTNLKFKNLGRIGSYMDFAGSSLPQWIQQCSVQPYLNCDGGTFSAVTFPQLAVFLGGTTLPDARGRGRFTLNQGTGRITSAGSNLDGNTIRTGGGDQLLQSHTHTGTTGGESVSHTHDTTITNAFGQGSQFLVGGGGSFSFATNTFTSGGVSADHTHSFTTAGSGSGASQNMPPAYMGGITMIRAG